MSERSSIGKTFKEHCNQIVQDDAGGKSSLKKLEELVEQDMAKTYKIPVGSVIPGNYANSRDKKSQLRGLWHQLTQHLVDLRYISEEDFVRYQANKKKILEKRELLTATVNGVEKYLLQETAPEIRELVYSTKPERPLTQFWIEQHLGIIVEAIAKYTSFDGSLLPPENYEVGEDSCYGRSLAFRIRVIFAMDEALDDADIFDHSMIKFTFSLDNILKLESDLLIVKDGDEQPDVTIPKDFWIQICDIDKLFEAFSAALPARVQGKAYAITYKYEFQKVELDKAKLSRERLKEAEENNDEVKRNDLKKGWVKKSNFKAKNYELVYMDRPAVNDSGNSIKWTERRIGRAERLVEGIYANIACRLLQLKLWQTSFYLGTIDGDWGEMSHQAVLDAYNLEVDLWKKGNKAHTREDKEKFKKYSKRTVKRSVFRKEQLKVSGESAKVLAVIAIDLEDMHQILQNYVSTAEEESAAGENEMSIIEELRKKPNIDDERLDKAILTEKSLERCYTTAGASPKRRVSYVSMKNKSFFRGLLRGIGKLVKWVIGAFKKVVGLIFSFAKSIIDRIRKGFQLFAKGFRYLSHLLLGRPITAPRKADDEHSPRIYTRFQLDFDAINFIPRGASSEAIENHINTLDMMRKSMFFFIDVVIFVIKAISKLSQPGGWVSLGIMIFRWLFGRLAELLRIMPKDESATAVA